MELDEEAGTVKYNGTSKVVVLALRPRRTVQYFRDQLVVYCSL
jgi:hypothetical protein